MEENKDKQEIEHQKQKAYDYSFETKIVAIGILVLIFGPIIYKVITCVINFLTKIML